MIMVFPTRERAPLEVREERGAGSGGVKVKRLKLGERNVPAVLCRHFLSPFFFQSSIDIL